MFLLGQMGPSQKIKAAKTESCITTLNDGLQKAGHKFYINAKDPNYYREASEPLRKHRQLIKYYDLNPSLRVFIEDLQNRNITIDDN
jgi:glycerophosphoryl diester phosphodiesterase